MADDATVDNGALTDYVVAAKDLGGGRLAQITVPYEQDRQDTYTAAGNGVTVDSTKAPASRFSIQVKGTGATPTSWEVVLEGSNNNSQFTTLIQHKSANGDLDGALKMWTSPGPVRYWRSRCAELTLGGSATNIVVTIVGETN